MSVKIQPTGLNCTVANGAGTIAGQSVGNVAVTCSAIPASFTHVLNNMSVAAVTPAPNKWVVAHSAYATASPSTAQPPLLFMMNRSTGTVDKVVQLGFDATQLSAVLGTSGTNWNERSFDIKSMRPTADGGVIVAMDIFGSTSTARAHVVTKLGATLGLDWAKVLPYDQFGTLEVKADGYASTGNAFNTYDLAGNLVASKSQFSTFSVTTANTQVLGGLGAYMTVAGANVQTRTNTNAANQAYYAGLKTATGGVLMVGYGGEGSDTYPVLVETNAAGTPTAAKRLSVKTSNGTGFRDVVATGGNYYAVGNYLTGVGTNIGWMVCKLPSSLASVTCKSVASGSGNLTIAADSTGNLVITRQADAPALMLDALLNPVYVPSGFTLSDLSTTAPDWSASWNTGSSTAMANATATPATVTVRVDVLDPAKVDSSKLNFLLFAKTAENLSGIDNTFGSGSGTITFTKNIASATGLKMVFTGTNTPYTNAVVTGTISGQTLTVSYTDTVMMGAYVDVIGTVTDATGATYNFRTGVLSIN
ncbi:hypothetical protein [Limnohabitans radicicola]|uniref:Uncharacterized protein n=1 Tax=Limnohabitans radicicola TaxID=2771427 RepID=A0A927FJY3_9BURK|nr:hypothetical protein [Limnohabitans radicicola]MBD8051963.1 hypothetical protein [Limnohabitans radicicola]